MNLDLEAGQGIQVTGPAKVRVIDGELSLLGMDISSNQEFIVKSGKQYPFEAKSQSKLELIGTDLQYIISEEPLIPPDRKTAAQRIGFIPTPARIMVLGQIDTGKSTVVCYLANHFLNQGKRVAVLDLDMGQQDIGPPCTITLGLLNNPILKLSDIPLHRMVFIGKTSPIGRMLQILTGAKELVDHALNVADIILIDTTGWVFGGAARAYKAAKIRTLEPDVLVALEKEDEIEHLLKPFQSVILVEKLSVYPHIEIRNSKTRKFLRESKFNNYFKNAVSRTLDLRFLTFENTFFRSGKRLIEAEWNKVEKTLECDFIYAEKAVDAIFLVKRSSSFYNKDKIKQIRGDYGVNEIRIVDKNDEKGLIVGLLDEKLKTLGIGLIENISYESDTIRIFTPVKEDIKVLQYGFLKITKTGQEILDQNLSF